MSKLIAEGYSCDDAHQGYLTIFIEGEKQFVYYTASPPFHWRIYKIVENNPQGEYWVKVIYANTGTKIADYECMETKVARAYGLEKSGDYSKVKGKILGVILTQESYESAFTYKLQVELVTGKIVKYLLTESRYGNRALLSKRECDPRYSSSAYPDSVQVADVIPITGGYFCSS